MQNAQNIQTAVGGLGSYIWAVSPMVMSKMKLTINDKETKDLFNKLYLKQPLLYKIIPGI